MAVLALSKKEIAALQGDARAPIFQVIVKHLEQCQQRQDFENCMWRMAATMKGSQDKEKVGKAKKVDDEKEVGKEQPRLSPLIDFVHDCYDLRKKGMCPYGHVDTAGLFLL